MSRPSLSSSLSCSSRTQRCGGTAGEGGEGAARSRRRRRRAARPTPLPSPQTCPFCLEPLSLNSLRLPCGHCFHSHCTILFLLKRKQCPCCRADVDEQQIVDVCW